MVPRRGLEPPRDSSHYNNLGWMGTFGNFPAGEANFWIIAFDIYNHTTTVPDTFIQIQVCP